MITIFKQFESIQSDPKVNDYVIIKYKGEILPTIGLLSYVQKDGHYKYLVELDVDDTFDYWQYGFNDSNVAFSDDEIIEWSKNKKQLKKRLDVLIDSDKYNL